MPSLQQLRYIVALADSLSFSRAAAISGVSQPTLSMQIKDLERRLGAVLVERSRARVVLTPLGEEVTRKARTVLATVEDIRSLSRSHGQGLAGIIRVGVVHTVGAYMLPLVVPELTTRHPDMRFHIREELPDVLMAHLDEGRHDIVIAPLPVLRGDFSTVTLFREPLMVVMPRRHPLAPRESIEHEALRGETILTMERGHRLAEQVSDLCDKVGASLSYDYEGTSLDTIRQMVAMGMGISIMPSLYVRSEVRREQLVVARPFATNPPARRIGLTWRPGNPRRDAIEAIAAEMKDILRRSVPEITVPQ